MHALWLQTGWLAAAWTAGNEPTGCCSAFVFLLLSTVLACLWQLVPYNDNDTWILMLTHTVCDCAVHLCARRAAADSPALLVHEPSLDRRDVFGLLGSSLLGSTFSQLYPAMLGLTSAGEQS
jgi:hypothetical protein